MTRSCEQKIPPLLKGINREGSEAGRFGDFAATMRAQARLKIILRFNYAA